MDDRRKATVVHRVRPGQTAMSRKRADDAAVIRENDLQLQRRLLDAVTEHAEKSAAIGQVCRVIAECHPTASAAYLDRASSAEQQSSQPLRVPTHDAIFEQLPIGSVETIQRLASTTCESGGANIHQLSGAHQWLLITVPVVLRGRPPEVLCAAVQQGKPTNGQLLSTLQLAASYLTLWDVMREARLEQTASQQTSALLELLTQLDETENWTTASYVLVNELRDYLGCDQIALGMTRGDQVDCKLAAVSGLSDFDKRSQFSEHFEAVMNEAILRNQVTVVSDQDDHSGEGTLAHQELHRVGAYKSVISAPLYDNAGEVVGAWLLLDNDGAGDEKDATAFVRASQTVIGSRLAKLRRQHVHPLLRPLRAVTRTIRNRKVVVALIAVCLFVGTMLIPMDYRIGCDCQLEPVSRRFVASPYDGTLEKSLVEAGEIVSVGQVLARMDARELRWEMSGYQADYESEKKKRDAASARDEVALAQQSNLEMQRLSLKMELVRHRLENLEIKSPVDGVVIVGDLKKAEGVPLTIGQTLFEIGPLDQMIVEVAVPESDILYVAEGMQVEVRLDADQSQMQTGSIVRVSPRSETRGSSNVYVAEVAFSNTDGSLRPGMKGSAKVISEPHSLGWNLFHKAWESFAMMVGC